MQPEMSQMVTRPIQTPQLSKGKCSTLQELISHLIKSHKCAWRCPYHLLCKNIKIHLLDQHSSE